MIKIVIDPSTIIDFTRAGIGQLPELLEDAKSLELELFIPTVVILEFWAGKSMELSENIRAADKLFFGIKRIGLTESIAKLAGRLLRQNRLTSPVDAIIAATALELDAKLATGNRRHFAGIKGLKFWPK